MKITIDLNESTLQGWHVRRIGKMLFVRLPKELQRDTGLPPCSCKRKGCDSKWDTLAVPIPDGDGSGRKDPRQRDDLFAATYTVHFPDLLSWESK